MMRSMWALPLLLLLLLTITTTHAFPTVPPQLVVWGRYVVLTGDNSSICLNVGEIEVYNTMGVNVARNATVWQSDYWDMTRFPASNLVDGDVNTIAHTSCRPGDQPGVPVLGNLTFPSVTTPVPNVLYGWIAMDVGQDMPIASVVIQNRRDPCCMFRLGLGVHVRIFNSQAYPAFVSNPLTTDLTQTLISTPTTTSTTTPTPTPATTAPTPTTTLPPTSPWYPYPSYSSTGSAWYPTSSPTPTGQDRGTFWPWSTPSGVLPYAKPAYDLNPSSDSLYHVIWQIDGVNQPSTTIPNGQLIDYGSTSQRTYYHATFTTYAAVSLFWNSFMPSSTTARAWIQFGSTVAQINLTTNGALMMLRYSYLWYDYRIPALSSNAEWKYSTYYVTARSRDGEFRMITYPTYTQAQQTYLAAISENAPTGDRQWTTVKLYFNGMIFMQSTTCRGSELEHLGAFQWLELPQRYSRYLTLGSYFMLVSWRSLSGVRLERMQVFTDWSSAIQAQAWVTWYSSTYDLAYYNRATSVIYYNGYISYYGNTDYTYLQQLQRDYYWVISSTTTTPGYPNPYSQPLSTRWEDLAKSQQTFIWAYPTGLIVGAVIILLITGCCLKRRSSAPTSSSMDLSPCFRRVTCIVVLLSIASLTLLIISISMKNFNTVQVKYSSTIWGMYGPFQVYQQTPYLAWLPVYWNAKVMGIVAGVAMIISMVASTATVALIKHSYGITSRTLFLSIIAFIFSLLAALVWIPVHIRVFDRNIEYAILQGAYPPQGNYSPYFGYSLPYQTVQQLVGTSYILLCVTVVIQLINVIIMSCIHKKCCTRGGSNTTQVDNDGLQLVQPTSPYYYRDVPTATPVPAVPAPYIYGVPASSAPPPFAFTHYQPQSSRVAYAAPMYYPPPAAPVAELLHEPIIAPAAYPAQAATPVAPGPASAGYPTLPVEVPLSGPSTSYRRLL